MLVPGVSGGSMAMILGIYQELISAVSSFRKQKKSNFLLLTVFCISAVFGMLVIATPISNLIDIFPKPTMYFFIGAVTGGIPLIFREAKATAFSWKFPVYILLGGIIVSAISLFPVNMAGMQEGEEIQNFLFLFAAGAIAAVALILPGISVSYLLLLLGLYDKTMQAINGLQFSFLISLFKYIPAIQNAFGEKKDEKKEETKAAVSETVEEVDETDDLELIAVISAAIAAAEETTTDGFVVRSIKRRPSNKWNS